MFSLRLNWFATAGVVAACFFLARPAWTEEEGEEVEFQGLLRAIAESNQVPVAPGAAYWIGIQAEPREEGGLQIGAVIPGSPAEKAGLKAGDVIQKIGREKAQDLEHLVRAVAKSEGQAMHLVIERDGRPQEVKVTPEKTPAGGRVVIEEEETEKGSPNVRWRILGKEGEDQRAQAQKALQDQAARLRELIRERQDADDDDDGDDEDEDWDDDEDEDEDDEDEGRGRRGNFFQLRVPEPKEGVRFQIHPGQPGARGMMLHGPGGFAGHAAHHAGGSGLPDDMEVTITKRGNKPAVVTVTQGVKMWQTDETELHMLPQPALAYVMRSLGHSHAVPGMGGIIHGAHPGHPGLDPHMMGGLVVPGGNVHRFEIHETPARAVEERKVEARKVEEKKPAEKKPEARKAEEKKPEAKKQERKPAEKKD